MQDMYPNLPGQLTEFKDGGLKLKTDPNPPSTESVLLLGTSTDGPLLEPVAVDQSTVEFVFGKAVRPNGLPNGSTLVKGFEQTYNAGCRDIRLMRVTGAYANGAVNAQAVTTSEDVPMDEQLGLAPGNDASTFLLGNAGIIASSVVVNANGVNLPVSAFTVDVGVVGATPVNGTVKLNPNVTDSNAIVYISYQYQDGANVISTTQSSYIDAQGVSQRYVASGSDTTFPLPKAVKAGTAVLYASGVTVDSKGFAVSPDGMGIVLHPGYVAVNMQLEVTYLSNETITAQPTLNLRSFYAGSLYNGVGVAVKDIVNQSGQTVGKMLEITKPDAKKAQIAEAPLTYSSLDYPSLQLMVNAVNGDSKNNVVRASVAAHDREADPSTLLGQPVTYLTGGNDGLGVSDQDMFEALGGVRDVNGFLTQQGAYQLLENYTVDHVVVVGVNADAKLAGKYDDFAAQLALACAVMSFRNHTTVGYIATSSPDEVGLKAVADQTAALLAHPNDYFMRDRQGNILKDSEGNNIDLGQFVNIVAGPDILFNSSRLGLYAENSAAAYAGYVSATGAQHAPTNKVQPYAVGLRFTYSNPQLDQLSGARYVTFKLKNNGAAVAVTDAMTGAQPGSDYVRLTTVRVVKEAVDNIREVADPYIGEPNETAQQNALSAAISKRLDQLKKDNVIMDYQFQIIATPQDKLLGQAKIELTIVPPQELRKLTTVVTLKPSL